ncbi:Fc.00g109390.m01.CDS01 [Cosmosporella sp. VM-42]
METTLWDLSQILRLHQLDEAFLQSERPTTRQFPVLHSPRPRSWGSLPLASCTAMDPATALGVASPAITFFDFTFKILQAGKEIYSSTAGAAANTLDLKESSQKLHDLCERTQTQQAQGGPVSSDVLNLGQLSESCKNDCQTLLEILQKLRVQPEKNRLLETVRVTRRSVKWRGTISDIESRLGKAQANMSLHVGTIIRNQVQTLDKGLKDLHAQTTKDHVGQLSKLDEMTKELQALKLNSNNLLKHTTQVLPKTLEEILNKARNIASLELVLGKQQAITESLRSETWLLRYDAIPKAHKDTFEWAFKASFSKWLLSDNGIFWISGKAGSGKSTLMKFLVDNTKTRELLGKWAGSEDGAVIAAHYFWAMGTPMQRTEKGLLQSFLFEIFWQCLSCIPQACPD